MMLSLCGKMSDAISRLGDALIVIDVNFFFERADESFSISVLPRGSARGDGNLNAMCLERGNIGSFERYCAPSPISLNPRFPNFFHILHVFLPKM